MMISNALKFFEKEEETKIKWTLVKEFLKIFSVLLIIFTIIFFAFFGCFLVLNDSASWTAQTVTLSSNGTIVVEYQLAEEEIDGVYNWYRQKDREATFLMYSNLGTIK